jgi:hypothetical protein
MPAPDLLDVAIRRGGPDERPGVGVGFDRVAVEGGLEIDQRGEAAPLIWGSHRRLHLARSAAAGYSLT